jgi:glycerophosphoryl diester phosphodiesterase
MAEGAESDVSLRPTWRHMSIQVFQHVKDAIRHLDPEDIRKHTDRPLRLLLYAENEQQYRDMEDYLLPSDLSDAKRAQARRLIYRRADGVGPRLTGDLEIYFDPSQELSTGESDVFGFNPAAPQALVHQVLHRRPDLAVPLALNILPFREEVSSRMVKKVAKENALFALATALPDIIPFISLPWAMGEFASDTAFLTANQIRMAFLLAAANDRDIGYHEQRGEIASIILGAFGWRALARELVGKIPWGAGLVPKAAIAYAGTRVVGMSLERYYRVGKAYTRAERRLAYEDALERGKHLVAGLVEGFQQRGSRSGS